MCLLVWLLFAAGTPSWVVKEGEVEVDWSLGTMTARGAAAADLRMPGPNSSRPGAERRAVVAADDRLRSGLRSLVGRVGETLPQASQQTLMTRTVTSRIEYQSNGGVVLWRLVRFADVQQNNKSNPSLISLRVPSMPFRVAPAIKTATRHVAPAYALYRRTPAPQHALMARWDADAGLTLVPSVADRIDSLTGAGIEIYIEKPEP
jgi:hypothetical protein